MTDYFVKPSGSNVADGLSEINAWSNIERAGLAKFSAGDVLKIADAGVSTPLHGTLTVVDDIIVKSSNGNTYLSGSTDVTDGAEYVQSNIIHDRNRLFQSWSSATNINIWTESLSGTSTINRESSNHLYGDNCLRMDIDASNNQVFVKLQGVLFPTTRMKVRVTYKTTVTGTLQFDVRDLTTSDWLQSDGSWDAALHRPVVSSSTDWAEYETPEFTPETNTGFYQFEIFGNGASQSSYVQAVELICTAKWTLDSGDIYRLSIVSIQPSIGFWKSLASDFLSKGLDSLLPVVEAASLGVIAAGEFFWDNTNDYLYYRLDSGETIANMHFEASIHDDCLINSANLTAHNIRAYGARLNNIINTAGTSALTDCKGIKGWKYGGRDTGGATVTWHNPEFAYNNDLEAETFGSNGYLCEDATVIINGINTHHNGDDGFQTGHVNADLTINGGASYSNLSEQFTATLGIYNINNVTFVDTAHKAHDTIADCFHDKLAAGVARSLNQCVFYGTRGRTEVVAFDNTPSALTESGNTFFGGAAPDLSGTFEDPLFTDVLNNDFYPLESSPLVATGTRWWTGSNPQGLDGEPYSDFDTDRGGIQSTLGPFHPVNL